MLVDENTSPSTRSARRAYRNSRPSPNALLVGAAELVGSMVLAWIVTMSILSWRDVNPFAGADNDGWAALSTTCYVFAAMWPPLLAAASIGYLVDIRPRSFDTRGRRSAHAERL